MRLTASLNWSSTEAYSAEEDKTIVLLVIGVKE